MAAKLQALQQPPGSDLTWVHFFSMTRKQRNQLKVFQFNLLKELAFKYVHEINLREDHLNFFFF
jgi:hypothetical protein